jgi:hypothetical protein
MAPALKALDPYGHLVSTSLTGGSVRDEYWQIKDLDYTVYHSYGDPAPARTLARLAAQHAAWGRPFMVGECGTSAYTLNLAADPYLRGYRQLLWAGVTGGSSGCSMTWWWEDVHSQDLYPIHAALARISAEAGWDKAGAWTPLLVADVALPENLGARIAGAEPFSASLPLSMSRNRDANFSLALANPLCAARAGERTLAYLAGQGSEYRAVLRLNVDAAAKAGLTLTVDAAAANAVILVRIDGAEALREALSLSGKPGEANAAASFTRTLPLTEGRHVIEIENAGAPEWLHLSALKLENLAPCALPDGIRFEAELTGIHTNNAALLHLVSPCAVFPANALMVNPPLVNDAVVTMPGLDDGNYRVRWYDTMDGRLVAEQQAASRGGKLTLRAPAFRDELAASVTRLP